MEFLNICQYHCPEVLPVVEGLRAFENGVQADYNNFCFEPIVIATDGFAKYSRWPGLATAGAAAYQLTKSGMVKGLIWTIPTGYPQTAAASEQ
jgi:hypothetical protein